ncbi:MAG: hypothetical protein GDA49_07330 [Rhodospirillales bacterium]|nr:hypothetical protein [Rhodospirillales bacterium]
MSLYGAWRLVRLDPEAMHYFNITIEGFFRSFFAVFLALPYFLSLLLWPSHATQEAMTWAYDPVLALVGYGLSWVVFPVVAALLARLFALTHSYVGYIVAWNWASALLAQPLLVLQLLFQVGMMPMELHELIQPPLFFFVMWYSWAIARIALGTGPWLAAGFAVVAELVDLVIFSAFIQPV